MSEPRRLRDEASSELLRAMIDAARAEEPPAGAVEKALLAIGSVPVGAEALTALAEAQSVAQTAAQLGAVGHGATAGLLLKWAGVGLAVGLATAYVAEGLSASETKAPTPVVAASAPVAPPREELKPAMPPLPSTVEAAPPASETPRAVAASPKAKTAPKSAAARLVEEVRALDGARKALARGEARKALATLDRYEREHRRGELLPEALLLRAEALAELGEREAAARVARRLVELQPNGPHASRARALAEGVLR